LPTITQTMKYLIPEKITEKRLQGFHLGDVTKPLETKEVNQMINSTVLRVINAKSSCFNVEVIREQCITKLVAQFGGELHKALLEYILSDVRARSGLAFQWLYEEYRICIGISREDNDELAQANYSFALTAILKGILEKHDANEGIFAKMMLQVPLLTEGSIKILQSYCENVNHSSAGLLLVTNLMEQQPKKRLRFLRLLLDLSTSSNDDVRNQTVGTLVKMYKNEELMEQIKQIATNNLACLCNKNPPEEYEPAKEPANGVVATEWTDVQMKQCKTLFLSLLPIDHRLIFTLAEVYMKSIGSVKRHILRSLQEPISKMGMKSTEILNLVKDCPVGAETLVTRMLHILTEKEHATAELTERVRELHRQRVPDIRFLIPVLTGLPKEEVLKALPKLIMYNTGVVQGVISRLLRTRRSVDSDAMVAGPVSPHELLVHLHNVELRTEEYKFIIKAIHMCLIEKSIYTPEVIVGVINVLLDQKHFPPLMMRTLIEALIQYPRMSSYVMSVLQKLIKKRAWNDRQTWQGFVKCCQRLNPQSFQIILMLQPAQLRSVFQIAPDIRIPLLTYMDKFTVQEKQHLPREVIEIIEKVPERITHKVTMMARQDSNKDKEKLQSKEDLTIGSTYKDKKRRRKTTEDSMDLHLNENVNESGFHTKGSSADKSLKEESVIMTTPTQDEK